MSNVHNHTVPNYGTAQVLQHQEKEDAISKFVLEFTPSDSSREKKFYEMLQSLIDHVIVFKRVVPYSLPKGVITP